MTISETFLSILPPESRAKIKRLLLEQQAAHDLYVAASNRAQEARQDVVHAEHIAQRQMEMGPGVVYDNSATHPAAGAVAAIRARQKDPDAEKAEREARILAPVEAARCRLQLAREAQERAARRQHEFAFLERVDAWLTRAAGFGEMRLRHFAAPAPKVRDPAAELAKLRSELDDLAEQWRAAENAPVPASELKARALFEIDQIAKRGEPTLDFTAREGSPLGLENALRVRQQLIPIPGVESQHFAILGDAGAAFWTWLHRDEIASRVLAMIDEHAPSAGTLTDEEREKEFARIAARRLEVERMEEALVVAIEAEGRSVVRRRDADPRAILEVVED